MSVETGVHVFTLRIYFTVFILLMAFTAITVGAAYVDLGPLNTVIMIAIAGTKATLVVVYFMHVRHSTRVIPLVIFASVFWLGILFVLLFSDYVSRGWLGIEGR